METSSVSGRSPASRNTAIARPSLRRLHAEDDDAGVRHAGGDIRLDRDAKRLGRGLARVRRSRGAPRVLALQRTRVEEAFEDCLSHHPGADDAEGSSGVQELW
jgi:hypothetical protein